MADKSIVLYASVSSNTRAVAEIVRAQTGADIEEIRPATPYTAEYSALVEQAKRGIRGQATGRRLQELGARPVRIRRDLSGHAQLVEHYRSAGRVAAGEIRPCRQADRRPSSRTAAAEKATQSATCARSARRRR